MKLSLIQRGKGKNLLFLHGYLASKECFASEIDYFSNRYRVTALDFPGFGNAEPLIAPWGVEEYANWLKAAMKELSLNAPLVIAHSFGGRVAIKANCFEKMLLTGCAGVVSHGLSYHVKVKTYRIVKRFSPKLAKSFGSAEYRTLSPLMRESYKKIVNEDLRKDAKRIDCPVLYVYGRQDSTTPPSLGKKLARATRGSLLALIEGGHFAYLDNPLSFRLLAEEFFTNRS